MVPIFLGHPVRCCLLSDFMRYQPCLREASLSPLLADCTKTLTESFHSVFQKLSLTKAQHEHKTIQACQFVIAACSLGVHCVLSVYRPQIENVVLEFQLI